MAQRRRTAPSSDGAPAVVIDASRNVQQQRSTPAQAGTTLGPAPQHPLYPSASPSRPSFTLSQAARQRRSASIGDVADDKDDGRRKLTTMDRLEGWFGLAADADGSATPSTSTLRPPSTRTLRPPSPSHRQPKSTQLVLVHAIAPNDTLEGVALRYGTDVRTLRRVNKLWPGDSVQVRKELFVPCKEEAVTEDASKLGLFPNGITASPHTRTHSVVSATSSEATSSLSRADGTESDGRPSLGHSPELRRVALQSLSYFPPPGTLTVSSDKGKERLNAQVGEELDHGESGVDDLLQLAERARLRGSSDMSPPPSPLRHLKSLAPPTTTNGRTSSEGHGSNLDDWTATSSPATSSRALHDEEWKPNKYTLGQRRRRNQTSLDQPRPLSMATDTATATPVGPAMMIASTGDHRSGSDYLGWNDIPEPPLSRSAQGKVAHAYKPKRRYPRPGVSDGGSALIDDLAAGLPPNPGPAANWARPIGDCLPVPLEASRRASSSVSHVASSSNWGQILSDTVRGKIRLEDALERGLEDIRAGFSSTATSLNGTEPAAPPRLRANGRLRSAVSAQQLSETFATQRPSAEMARVALAGGDGDAATKPSSVTPSSSSTLLGPDQSGGPTLRRSSGRSLHELEDLRVQAGDEHRNATSSTWSAAANGTAGGVGRRNVRNVDWLG